MDWKGIFSVAKTVMKENRSAVLFGSGVVCMGACVVLTAKAAPEADYETKRIFSAKKNGLIEDNRQLAKMVARDIVVPYIPAAVAGAAAITSFALSNRDLSKRAAGAVAAYSVAERALTAYQDNVVKELGEEVHETILKKMVDDIPEDVLKETEEEPDDSVVVNRFHHELNDKLYYDHVTGRIFWSSDEKIKDAESTVNKLLIDVGMATINDFYSALLLDCDSTIGDAIGWKVEDPHARNLDVVFGSRLDRENNIPLITIGYRTCAVNLRELERR